MNRPQPSQALRTARKLLCVMIAVAPLLQGCSSFKGSSRHDADNEPTLADLKPAKLPEMQRQLPQVGLTKVAENYRAVLKNTDDPEMRVRVTQRLADLQMLSSEQSQLATTQPGQRHFDGAIKEYQALLVAHPNRPDNDKLMYQLSKAYDMDGRNDESLQILNRLVREYPQSSVIVEAQFRRGELLFARQQYAAAEGAYAAVMAKGVDSNYYQNALYMHGWAQFKRNDYEAALGSFTQALDKLWPAGTGSDQKSLDDMSRTERELVNDTLRVMSLSFSNLEGAKTITETYRRLGERHYIPELYTQLGQLYLQQKRYRDAAETYRAFVDAHPLAPEAPAMYVHLIDAYAEGNFPSEVLAQKATFIKLYGVHGTYQGGDSWTRLDEPARESVRGYLKDFLTELAQYHHGLAQQNKTTLANAPTAKGDKTPRDAAGEVITRAGVLQSYRSAGDYYREYIDSFPQAADVGAKMFLLAESRFEAEDYPAAIDAYEIAAYQYTNNERGAEAGYSALLAYEMHGKQLAPEQQAAWQQRRTASELRFAKTYPQDRRAATVQTHAAEELFARKDYVAAIAAATPVTQWQPIADEKLRRSAWLIIAHGYFEQQDFVQAEQAYRQASALIAANDPQRAAVQDRLAASVYKQGEQKLAGGDKAAAAQQFLRVAQVAPDSAIRVNAQYDAATQFMDGGNYQDAISTLNDLRARFPDHALSAGVSNKLAAAYLSTGQSAAAAAELTRVAQQDGDPATRREALLSAAELYQKAGDTNNAVARYRDYVQQYPAPFGQAMEARYQITELLKTTGGNSQANKVLRRQWLDQIISADAAAGAQRSDRSRFLAAQAQDEIAEGSYQLFIAERLTLPLKESLKRKRAALDEALGAYQRSGDYGVQEFSTKATYRIGDIYANLAQALTKSERPPNLSALELEQYEVLLEEQADPFVEKAISVHEGNIKRSWNGIYDDWVQKSFVALESLLPARYRKSETRISASEEIN
ncbi:MAG: tetratricopeptide repeat protein, partial [Spongiibacteraceae bacterium]